MKNLLLIALLSLICSIQVYAQSSHETKAPKKVLKAFHEKFPAVEKVEWEKEGKKEWEAEFEVEGKEYSASFRANGDWIETEHEIEEADIPSEIRSLLSQNFSKNEIEEAEVVETSSGRGYEFEIEVGNEEFEVRIDAEGTLSKKKEKDDNHKE